MAEINITEKHNSYQLLLFTILRIVLGLILFVKAIMFIRATALLQSLIEVTGVGAFSENSRVLAFIIAYLGLLCGFFITVGLFTKASSIVQIPILIVAVFFVNIKNMGESNFELVLSVITLLLLILFAIKGSGTLSASEYFRRGAEVDKKAKA